MDLRFLTALLLGNAVANLVTVLCAILLLRLRSGATAADLGWSSKDFFSDVRVGLVAFVALAVPIYALQISLTSALPKYLAADPLTLLLLSLALGTLYYRTHRIVPAIVVHMLLNATSLAFAWLLFRQTAGGGQ